MRLDCQARVQGAGTRSRRTASRYRWWISVVPTSTLWLTRMSQHLSPCLQSTQWQVKACGQLQRHMYGTRHAAQGWQHEYSTTLLEMGFLQGLASPCMFHHPSRSLASSVYGDDFITTGSKRELDWFEAELEKRYELTKGGRLGPGENDAKEGTILNRVVRRTVNGLEYEADPRQCERLLEQMGLEGANSVSTPGETSGGTARQ